MSSTPARRPVPRSLRPTGLAAPGDVVEFRPEIGTLRNRSLPSSTTRPTSSHRRSRSTEPLLMRPFCAVAHGLAARREATMRRFRPSLAEHGLTEQQWRVLDARLRRSADRGLRPGRTHGAARTLGHPHRRPSRRRRHGRDAVVGDAADRRPHEGGASSPALRRSPRRPMPRSRPPSVPTAWPPFPMSSTISPSCSTSTTPGRPRDRP